MVICHLCVIYFADSNCRPFLKEIKSMGEMRIVLDCKLDTIHEVLKQAQQVSEQICLIQVQGNIASH